MPSCNLEPVMRSAKRMPLVLDDTMRSHVTLSTARNFLKRLCSSASNCACSVAMRASSSSDAKMSRMHFSFSMSCVRAQTNEDEESHEL